MSVFMKIIVFFCVVCLVAVGAGYFFTISKGETIIRGILEKKLTKVIGQQVTISTFETNLFTRVRISGFTLVRKPGAGDLPFVSIGNAHIEYRLWRLLRRKPLIDLVTLDSLSVSVVRDSSGFYLPGAKGEKKQDSARKPLDFGIRFGRLDIQNSSCIYNDRTIPLFVSAGEIDVHIRENGGDVYGYRLHADSWEIEYRDQPVSVKNLAVTGTITQNSITVEPLELNLPGLHCEMKSTIKLDESHVYIDGNMSIQGNIVNVAELFREHIPLRFYPQKGTVITNVAFTGPVNDPLVTVSLGIEDLQLEDTSISEAIFEGDYHKQKLNFARIRIGLFGGIVSGGGTMATDSLLTHDVTLAIEGIDLERIWKMIYKDTSPYRGQIKGDLHTNGPLKIPRNLTASAHLSLENVSFRSQKLADFTTGVSYENGLFNLEFRQSTTELQAEVMLIDDNIEGDFVFHTIKPGNLTGFVKIFELSGSLDIKGTLSGKARQPVIVADFDGKNIRFQKFPIDTLKGRALYKNGNIEFEESEFTGNIASIDSLTYSTGFDGLNGAVTYNGSLKGPVNNPVGRVELHSYSPNYKDFRLNSIDAILSIAEKKIKIEHSRIAADSLAIDLHGIYTIPTSSGSVTMEFLKNTAGKAEKETDSEKIPAEPSKEEFLGTMHVNYTFADAGNIELKADGSSLNIGHIAGLYADSLEVDGMLGFELDFRGTPVKPVGSLSFKIDSPSFRRSAMDSVISRLRIDPDRLEIEMLEMYLNERKTWMQFDIELKSSPKGYPTITGQSHMNCSGGGSNFVVELIKLVIPPDMTMTGESSFRIECDGMVKEPRLRGDFQLQNAELSIRPGSPPVKNLNISVTLQDTTFILDHAEGTIIDIPFLIRGWTSTSDWERFKTDMSVRISDRDAVESAGYVSKDSLDFNVIVSGFDITILQPLLSKMKNLTGTANATLALNGPLRSPAINGTVNLSDVSLLPPFQDTSLTQGFAALRFDSDTIMLDSLSVSSGKGTLRASGSVAHSGGTFTQVSLSADMSNIAIARPKEYTLLIDTGHLTCKKQDDFYDIGGEIILGESRFIKDIEPKAFLPFAQKVERPSESPSQITRQIRMNVLVRGNKKLWIDNNLARMLIRSEIEIIGTLARPNMTGRLSVEEGYILYLDKKFRIDRGIVDFIDPNSLEPIIDFQASTTVKSYQTLSKIPYEITLTVSGPLENTTFGLTSDPVLDKSDILTLLTVGATREQLTGRSANGVDTSLSEILKERAEVLSSRRISGYFSRKVGNLLGLEEIDVEGNLFNIGKSSGPQLVASEKISDRVGITYTTAVGHLNEQKIRLDYRLSKYFSLEGQTDQKGRSGIDVKYRLRFK